MAFSTKSLVNKYKKLGSYSTGYKSKAKSYSNSSFWMDDEFLEDDDSIFDNKTKKSVDYVKLAGYKRAIGNFVRIVTSKDDVSVKFSSGRDSYTDGKTVVISSKLDEKEFDTTVGLALHEGSHIALTNFAALEVYFNSTRFQEVVKEFDPQNEWGSQWTVKTRIKTLVNIIEDRRIDRFVYNSAPGYQGYYKAMYDKYFNDKTIDKALLEGKMTDNTWDSYEFHICNFANPNRQLGALPLLKTVWDMIDIRNINRLPDTYAVIELAEQVFKTIMSGIGNDIVSQEEKPEEGEGQPNNQSGEGQSDNQTQMGEGENDDMGGAEPNLDNMPSGMNGEASSNDDGNASEQEGEGQTKDPVQEAKDRRERQQLDKARKKQKDFMDGNIKKSKLSKKDAEKVNAASESNMSYAQVGGDIPNDTGNTYHKGTTNCMVVHGITQSLLDAGLVDGHGQDPKYIKERITTWGRKDYIAEGLVLGTMLGKRLKTRDEDRSLKTTRMETGRIDRRLIAELGFGNDRVFNQTIHQTVTPGLIHISIDASGSMGGDKWSSAMKTAVAIAKAADMVSSLDCVISIRGSVGNYYANQSPLMWVVYDSRKEKLAAVKDKLYGVQCSGSTPEGLCYQAVMKEIIDSAKGKDMYFINLCDGEPGYGDTNFSYGGEYAITHTAAQINKMRKAGIKVLGYFVCENSEAEWVQRSMNNFRRMYGASSEYIDTNNLTQLAASLNKLFVIK